MTSAEPIHDEPREPSDDVERLARRLRGLGFLSTLLSFVAVGAADGVLTALRMPAGARRLGIALRLIAHAVAMLSAAGLVVGLGAELVVQAAVRRPAVRALVSWLLAGPRRWFARDAEAALRIALGALLVLPGLGLLFVVTSFVTRNFHSNLLMATAVTLSAAGWLVFGSVLGVVVAWPLEWLLARLGRLASPGAVVALLSAGGAAVAIFVVWRSWDVFRNLDLRGAVAVLVGLLGLLALLFLLGKRLLRRERPIGWRVFAAAAAATFVAFFASGRLLVKHQAVLTAISERSLVTRRVLGPLQRSVDFDRDGYGALFGGGDCDDFDASKHPGARDIPGNGIDENCSGADGKVESQLSDGHMARVELPFNGAQPSVFFLSIDALRPDHTSMFGYARDTTPNLARWAKGAARFSRAYCTSPRSLTSFASVFTGRYPSDLAWGSDAVFPPLKENERMLAPILRSMGYATGAFGDTTYFSRVPGFEAGFDVQKEQEKTKAAAPAVREFTEWVRAKADAPSPFFAWFHLFEPHDAYRDLREPVDFGHAPMDRYDEEIARADFFAGQLLATAEEIAQKRPLLVFVFSDHGEGWGEHGVFNHAFDLHEEAARVILFARGPGIAPGDRVALTSLADLFPTILNAIGKPAPVPIPSWSLLPVLQSPGPAAPPDWRARLYAEVWTSGWLPGEKRMMIEDPYKLIYDAATNGYSLYDLARDPRELVNLYDDEPQVAASMREHVLNWMDFKSPGAESTGEIIAKHRLAAEPPMQHTVHERFPGVVELLGYDMPKTRFRAGDSVEMTLYYRVLGRTPKPYWTIVDFNRDDGREAIRDFHMRHYPLDGHYSTTRWLPGEILRDEMSRRVEPGVPPGRYKVVFTVDPSRPPEDRERPLHEVNLGTIEIVP